jgi:hypothetical protein
LDLNGSKKREFLDICKNNRHPQGQELQNQRNSMKKLRGGSECKMEKTSHVQLFKPKKPKMSCINKRKLKSIK